MNAPRSSSPASQGRYAVEYDPIDTVRDVELIVLALRVAHRNMALISVSSRVTA